MCAHKDMQTHKHTHTHALPPPARGLLVKLKGVSAFPHTPLLSLSSSLILIKRLVSEAPSGVAGEGGRLWLPRGEARRG